MKENPTDFIYSEHRTVDSKNNVIVNVHVEPANVNDITPLPTIRHVYLPGEKAAELENHNA